MIKKKFEISLQVTLELVSCCEESAREIVNTYMKELFLKSEIEAVCHSFETIKETK